MAHQMAKRPAAPSPPAARDWPSRIVGSGVKRAADFLSNPSQWKVHSHAQEHALVAMLGHVGWVAPVVENVRTGHLVDGHLRVLTALDQGEDTPVPYVQVDLSEAQEQLALASMDPIMALSGTDDDKYDALLATTLESGVDLAAILSDARPTKKRGLKHKVIECSCCRRKCKKGCGCWREKRR